MHKQSAMTTTHHIVKSGIMQAVAKGVSMLAGSVIMIMLARTLGPEDYGRLGLIASLIATFGFINNLGLAGSIARYMSDNIRTPKQLRRIAWQGLFLNAIILTITGTLFLVFLPSIARLLHAPELTAYGGIILLLMVLRSLIRSYSGIYQGLGRLDQQAYPQIIQILSYLFGVWALVIVAHHGIIGALAAQSTGLLLQVILSTILVILLLRSMKQADVPDTSILDTPVGFWWPCLLRYGLPLFFVNAGYFIYRQSDILLIQYFRGSEQLSCYYIQYRIIQMLMIPLTILAGVTAPYFSLNRLRLAKQQELLTQSLRVVMLFYFPAAVGLAFLADAVIVVLFGTDYLPGLTVFRMFALGFMPFFALSAIISQALNFRGQAVFRAWVLGISAALNIGLNLILIPRMGIKGAALATQITYIPAVLIYIREICKQLELPTRQFLIMALRVFGAIIGMLAALFITRNLLDQYLTILIVCPVVGALVYLPLARLTGAWTASDIQFLKTMLTRNRTGVSPNSEEKV